MNFKASSASNFNGFCWKTFATYDEVDIKILLVYSYTFRIVKWIGLDVVVNKCHIYGNRLNLNLLFFGERGFKSNSNYFVTDFRKPSANEEK